MIKAYFQKFINFLKGLSFRTGVTVALFCLLSYAVSFAQMLLPISAAWKGALWVIFFGLAKTLQYTAILILGKAGVERLRRLLKRKKDVFGDMESFD